MTVHRAQQLTVKPLEIVTWCGQTSLTLPAGDSIVFEAGLHDCALCRSGRLEKYEPRCMPSTGFHVVGIRGTTCQCGERVVTGATERRVPE